MPPLRRPFIAAAFAALLVAGALPRAFAQAGLSGNALSGQWEELRGNAGKIDSGLKSQSALGQLEELAGAKVDRSGSTNTSANQRQQAPRVPAKRILTTNQQITNMVRQELATAVVESLLSGLIFGDPAADARAKAEAEAAAAAAEAARIEAQRAAEAARLAQQQFAANLRAAWDAQDASLSDNLSGAFDVHAGTAFFGEGASPDADDLAEFDRKVAPPDAADGSAPVVTLPDREHLGVDPATLAMPAAGGAGLTTGPAIVTPSPTGYWVRPDDPALGGGRSLDLIPRTAAEEAALHGAKWYVDTMQEAAGDSMKKLLFGGLMDRLERLPGAETMMQLWDLKEKYEALRDPLKSKVATLQELAFSRGLEGARLLGSDRTSDGGFAERYNDEVAALGGEMAREYRGLAFNEAAGRAVDSPEFGPSEDIELGESSVRPLTGWRRGPYGHLRLDR